MHLYTYESILPVKSLFSYGLIILPVTSNTNLYFAMSIVYAVYLLMEKIPSQTDWTDGQTGSDYWKASPPKACWAELKSLRAPVRADNLPSYTAVMDYWTLQCKNNFN